jgi:hypothetical protein
MSYSPPEGGVAPTDENITLSDVETNNASTAKHGFLKKLDNDPSHFLNGQGAWRTPSVV